MVIQHQMNNNNNRFEIVCDENIGEITGDELRLRQVLLNLLSNSAKFTRNGMVTLVVKRQGLDNSNNLLLPLLTRVLA
jgi:signal transduction histidine kinase